MPIINHYLPEGRLCISAPSDNEVLITAEVVQHDHTTECNYLRIDLDGNAVPFVKRMVNLPKKDVLQVHKEILTGYLEIAECVLLVHSMLVMTGAVTETLRKLNNQQQ